MYAAAAFMDSKRTWKIQNHGSVLPTPKTRRKKKYNATYRLAFGISKASKENILEGIDMLIRDQIRNRCKDTECWFTVSSAGCLTTFEQGLEKCFPFGYKPVLDTIIIHTTNLPTPTHHLFPNPSLPLQQWYRLLCVECLDRFHWQEPSKEVPWHCFWCYPGSFPKDEHRGQQPKWTAWKQDDAKGHCNANATRDHHHPQVNKHGYSIQTLFYLHFRVLGDELSQSDEQEIWLLLDPLIIELSLCGRSIAGIRYRVDFYGAFSSTLPLGIIRRQ